MSDPREVEQFPALSNKLSAPKKESLYQRQKQEAEAKRLREEAETAAALDDFVKSLNDEDNSQSVPMPGGRMPARASARGGPNRHFVPSAKKSGPGTLDPAPSLSRKRSYDGPVPPRKHLKGPLAFDDGHARDSDDDGGRLDAKNASSKPTIHMSHLPLGTSQAVIKALLPDNLMVDAVRVLTPSSNTLDRKSQSAIVTFATSTPIASIDAAVTTLQHRYLGWGFYLSLSRGLSTAAQATSAVTPGSSSQSSLPFGAKAASSPHSSLRHAPPPASNQNSRFAPPTSYSSPTGPAPRVHIIPPSSIGELRLIHKTVESLLTYGPEFEALLMTRSSVQRDEKWAWIWDPRSPGGVWYRWRIWELASGLRQSSNAADSTSGKARLLFEGGAPWVEPVDGNLPFEFTTDFDTLVDEQDYDSSGEDDSGDESGLPRHHQQNKNERYNTGRPPPDLDSTHVFDEDSEPKYLNPLHRAKLIHLLSRLPASTAKLRTGDVARISAFAIVHAGAGAVETCELLVMNVLQPLCLQKHLTAMTSDDENEDPQKASDLKGYEEDRSQPTMVAIRIVSDLLSASSASGVRHAWKYRQLMHSSLAKHGVFGHLGRMEREIAAHGRIRAEKWHRSIAEGVLGLWEKWGVFLSGEMDKFIQEFEASSKESDDKTENTSQMHDEKPEHKAKKESRWRTVDDTEVAARGTSETEMAPNTDSEPSYEDVDGEPMTAEDLEDELNGNFMSDSSGEGLAREEQQVESNESGGDGLTAVKAKITMKMGGGSSDVSKARHRPRAVDLFADSDGESA